MVTPNFNYVDLFSEIPKNVNFAGYVRSLLKETYISIKSSNKDRVDGNFLKLIYCHHVFDDQVDEFKITIEMLQKHGEFISTKKCLDIAQGKSPLDGKYYHISFDDGFRNIYKNAFPVLIHFNIPALFFVPTSFIEAPFNIVSNYCIETLKVGAPIELVTWDDLEQMINCNIDIGSHTKHHVNLASISNDSNRMLDEILGSKDELESRLGVKSHYFSWPFGEKKHINDTSIDYIKNAGYAACFSAIRGDIQPKETDIFYIPRNHFEVNWSLSSKKYFLL
jgi:peptidoglycan/xylan/chitin deacetylase (PgdA/CDA1 family)